MFPSVCLTGAPTEMIYLGDDRFDSELMWARLKAYAALGGADFQALKDNFDAPHGETCAPPIAVHPLPAPTSEEADAAVTDAVVRLAAGTT